MRSSFLFRWTPPPPTSTLFPYTTLFRSHCPRLCIARKCPLLGGRHPRQFSFDTRSEEHTSELQSRGHLVCRLLLEKKKALADRPQTLLGTKAKLKAARLWYVVGQQFYLQ